MGTLFFFTGPVLGKASNLKWWNMRIIMIVCKHKIIRLDNIKKMQYLRHQLYDSDFKAIIFSLSPLCLLYDCSLRVLWLLFGYSNCSDQQTDWRTDGQSNFLSSCQSQKSLYCLFDLFPYSIPIYSLELFQNKTMLIAYCSFSWL